MDKSRKKALKTKFKEEQQQKDAIRIKSAHPFYTDLSTWDTEMQFTEKITPAMIKAWHDDRLEQSILSFVDKKISQANYILGKQFTFEKELEVLNLEIDLLKYFFVITRFEQYVNFQLSTFDYFLAGDAVFAEMVLQGYDMYHLPEMQDLVWQSMGAYTKMQTAGEVEELMGCEYNWNIDYPKLIHENTKTFEELDKIVASLDFEDLQEKRIRFFRDNLV